MSKNRDPGTGAVEAAAADLVDSPYTPGSAPRVFAGRREQLEAARHDLALVATYGRFIGRIRIETGVRGVGKTSLLIALRDEAAQAGFIPVFATARQDESLVLALTDALRQGLDALAIKPADARRIRERIKKVSIEVGAGPVKAGVEVDTSAAAPAPTTAAFRDLLAGAARAARDRGSAGLCLLIDEVQAAAPADLRTVCYAWQELQAVPEPPAAVLFGAGLPNTPDVLTAAVTFAERFAFRSLERLGDDDAEAALVGPAAQSDVRWSAPAVREVVARAQGFPYYLQLIGDAVWRSVRPRPGDVLSLAAVRAADGAVAIDLQGMFRARWAKAAPGERRLLAAMAAEGDDQVRRATIAARLQVRSNDLSVPRQSLIDKGLIEAPARGWLRFTTPGFAQFVRDQQG